MRLDGKRVILTGAAGGLGEAIARACVAEGAAALLLADINESAAHQQAESLTGFATDTRPVAMDVTDPDSVEAAVALALDTWAGVDVFINNAGVLSQSARVHNTDPLDFERVIRVNLLGVFNGMKAVLPAMRRARAGSIINTASVAGLTAWTHSTPYCATKAAVIHMTKVAAVEYARENIRVNAVCPGTFLTAIHDEVPAEAIHSMTTRHPIGRLASAAEIAGAFIYLASDESSFTTGSALVVDGGYSAL